MKRFITLPIAFIATALMLSQIPDKMSYQAVIRDAGGVLVSNTTLGMQISILMGDPAGMPVYVENQNPVTNENGLISIEIGGGSPVQGSFQEIDWSSGNFFLKTETDPSGGTNYSISGITQILSVPFAMYAKTAENVENVDFTELDPAFETSAASSITSTDIDNWNNKLDEEEDPLFQSSAAAGIGENDITTWNNKLDMEVDGSVTNEIQTISRNGSMVTLSDGGGSFTDSVNTYRAGNGIKIVDFQISMEKKHYVGEIYLGGIIFFVDHTGEHGLIASLCDLDGGNGVTYSDVVDQEIGEAARSATDGVANTNAMIAQQKSTSAAQLCRNLGPEWYLPSNREVYLLFQQEILIDRILDNDGDPDTHGLVQEYDKPTRGRYWSSTEEGPKEAWGHKSSSGDTSHLPKTRTQRVRAIRAF